MDDVDLGHRFEQFAGQMARRADSSRAVAQCAWLHARKRDQLRDRRRLDRWIDDQKSLRIEDVDDRCEILDRVERHNGQQTDVDGMRTDVADHQRVAIRRRLGDNVRADVSACSGPIVDDDRLAPRFGELSADLAPERVGDAADRERHHDADRLVGIGRCLR